MFGWLRSVFRSSEDEQWQDFLESIDALNAQQAGGRPTVVSRELAKLRLPSRTLVLADPQELPNGGISILSGIEVEEAEISASLWRYPTGHETVVRLRLRWGDYQDGTTTRTIGNLGIDSAAVVVADKVDIEKHWTEVGPDRTGVIVTARDDAEAAAD